MIRRRRKGSNKLFPRAKTGRVLRIEFESWPEETEETELPRFVGGGIERPGAVVYDEKGKVVYHRYSIRGE